MTLKNAEIVAYTAGIIDGEGSVCLAGRGIASQWRYPQISVSMTTIEVLEWLKKEWGGSISAKAGSKPSANKESWIWKLSHGAALEMAELVLPYLLEPEKKRRADLLVRSYKAVTSRNGFYLPEGILAKAEFEREFFKNSTRRHRRLPKPAL